MMLFTCWGETEQVTAGSALQRRGTTALLLRATRLDCLDVLLVELTIISDEAKLICRREV